ncbi:ead/Ea22-like family protein [Escherichia marmotae]|uniref:ead/Ea22-like family protein n=2 Tax=Escherichia TaxID=561 RepID=UPI00398231B4
MSKIDYQALREAAERATPAMERLLMLPVDDDLLSEQELKDYGVDIDALNAFKLLAGPETVLALLDERERNQQYIKSRDQENEEIALTVGKLRVELEETKSKLNEQREYYEGVIADGSKRIAELERSEEQLINERDHAESALDDMYFAATGDRPEWSNWFGFSDAVDAVVDRIADLEAKQPSPVVLEGLIKAVRFYEQVKRENPPVETGAWKDAVDWVLKEACQAASKESDMAIAASYTMHLYCDCLQCTDGKYKSPDFGEYIGTSWAGCAKEAHKDGWRISKDKTRAFAPGHKVLRVNK